MATARPTGTQLIKRTHPVQRIPALPKTMRLRDVLGEGRALFELGTLPASLPALLALSPRGDGQPVLTLPGLMATDGSMAILRRYLRELGYSVHPWNLGRNLGPNAELRAGMMRRLEEIEGRVGRRVSIVGWSLGGIYARELARRNPRLVRQVITLASPFAGIGATNIPLLRRMARRPQRPAPAPAPDGAAERMASPVPLPATAIFTRGDGVVAWRACMERPGPRAENIEVRTTHTGIGMHPPALWAVADRLAWTDGPWKPFVPPLPLAPLYGRARMGARMGAKPAATGATGARGGLRGRPA